MENKMNVKQMVGIFAFCAGAMAANMTMGLLGSIMQDYVPAGVSPTVVQTLLVTPALIGTIYGFLVGPLNKAIPSKYLIMICELAMLLYGIIFFTVGKNNIYVLIAAAGLAGINQGAMNVMIGLQLAAAITDDAKRGTMFGITSGFMNVMGVIIQNIGGKVAAVSGSWNKAYLVWIPVYVVELILTFICLPNVAPEGKNAPAAGGPTAAGDTGAKLSMTPAFVIAIHYFFYFLVLYVFGTNVSDYILNVHQLGDASAATLGASMVTIGGIFAGFLYAGYFKVLKKWTVPVLMGLCVIALALPIFITTSLVAIYICGFVLGFAMMGCNPYIMNYLHELFPNAQYGQAMSIFAGFMNFGMVVAIYVINFLTKLFFGDASNMGGKFTVAAIGCLIVFITSIPIYALGKGRQAA